MVNGAGSSSLASLEAATLTLLEVAWALEYLHHMHIVHRDLKPTNVLLASSPVRPFCCCGSACSLVLRAYMLQVQGPAPASRWPI